MDAAARNAWLRMADTELMGACHEDRYKASGPGGQRRNKVTTAVRMRHGPTGVHVQAEEGRTLEENRRRAVRRIRERIAIEVRALSGPADPQIPPEFEKYVTTDGRLSVNPKNHDYPLVVATLLDALAASDGSYAAAAASLGLTTSQLAKFLESDREVWRWISEGHLRRGKNVAERL